jgi:hypothetical protein
MRKMDDFVGMDIHCYAEGSIGLIAFRSNGYHYCILFFSLEQIRKILGEHSAAFVQFRSGIDNTIRRSSLLPESSTQELIIITGQPAEMLCMFYAEFLAYVPPDMRSGHEWISRKPQLIGFFYPEERVTHTPAGKAEYQKRGLVITLMDAQNHFHAYVVYSIREMRRTLFSYPELRIDIDRHVQFLAKESSLPMQSELLTVHLGCPLLEIVAEQMAKWMFVTPNYRAGSLWSTEQLDTEQ